LNLRGKVISERGFPRMSQRSGSDHARSTGQEPRGAGDSHVLPRSSSSSSSSSHLLCPGGGGRGRGCGGVVVVVLDFPNDETLVRLFVGRVQRHNHAPVHSHLEPVPLRQGRHAPRGEELVVHETVPLGVVGDPDSDEQMAAGGTVSLLQQRCHGKSE
jgi:hypothetical protein